MPRITSIIPRVKVRRVIPPFIKLSAEIPQDSKGIEGSINDRAPAKIIVPIIIFIHLFILLEGIFCF